MSELDRDQERADREMLDNITRVELVAELRRLADGGQLCAPLSPPRYRRRQALLRTAALAIERAGLALEPSRN